MSLQFSRPSRAISFLAIPFLVTVSAAGQGPPAPSLGGRPAGSPAATELPPAGTPPDSSGATPASAGTPASATSPTWSVDPPPPPRLLQPAPTDRPQYEWSLRFNPISLIFGKANIEVEKALTRSFTLMVAPQWVYNDYGIRRADVNGGLKASGGGVLTQLGWWISGEALQGSFLKAHFEYNSLHVTSNLDSAGLTIPYALLGAVFGSQRVIGGFTFCSSIGVGYDLANRERSITYLDRTGVPVTGVFQSGLVGNGWDIIGQLAFGASF